MTDARELLAKPVATDDAITDFFMKRGWLGRLTDSEVNDILAALSHFAPPARPRMMIEGMSVDELEALFLKEWEGQQWAIMCADIAHRLATTPAPEVDTDTGPRDMCNAWAREQNAKPGPIRDLVPEFDQGNEEWRQRWRDHYAWVMSGFPNVPTWAAAKKEAGGE